MSTHEGAGRVGHPPSQRRSSSRAQATRLGLLEAAREVFTEQGFAAASIQDVVDRADASVGSLYHHFGGKVDLFLALWEDHRLALEETAAEAVATRRAAGQEDPVALFVAGAQAYLQSCWERRAVATFFLAGDGPPGFELLRRQNTREWLRQNAVLLQAEGGQAGRALVVVLTTTIAELGREITTCRSAEEADELVEAALPLIARLCEAAS